jgi:hypothetical protein
MSSVQLYETTKQRADHKHGDYGFILALVCMALALVVASAIFKPTPVGTGVNDQIWFVGP